MDVRILLVEGNDDQHVMWNLFKHWPETQGIFVCKPGDQPDFATPGQVKIGSREGGGLDGDAELLKSISARLVASGLERMAIVIDSDEKGPQARWDAIRKRLKNEGYEISTECPNPEGTVLELPSVRGRKPIRFGVWIMPDNCSTGMLEDFVIRLIRDDDDMLPRVDGFLDSIPEDRRRYSPAHRPKARMHTWLAVSERPGRPMGQAIGADRGLNAEDPAVDPFLDWLRTALVE